MHCHMHQTSQHNVDCSLSICGVVSVVVDLHVAVFGQSSSGCYRTPNATDRQTDRKAGPFIQGFLGFQHTVILWWLLLCADASCQY